MRDINIKNEKIRRAPGRNPKIDCFAIREPGTDDSRVRRRVLNTVRRKATMWVLILPLRVNAILSYANTSFPLRLHPLCRLA